MLVAFTVNHRELNQSVALAHWIAELGGCKNHDVLVCLTRTANRMGQYAKIEPILSKAFKTCALFVPHDEVEVPWPNPQNDASSANHFFKRVSQHTEWNLKRSFLWFEMDAVPLKESWLDAMETEYQGCKKPFMGVRLEMPGVQYLSGVSIYPANITQFTPRLRNAGTIPFDAFSAADVMQYAHFTELIQFCPFSENGNRADWSVQKEPMREGAVLYHRNKDLSLIDSLRKSDDPFPMDMGDFSGMKTPAEPVHSDAPVTITAQIRQHCDELSKLEAGMISRKKIILNELRKRKLVPMAKARK